MSSVDPIIGGVNPTWTGPSEMARLLAGRIRGLRLLRGWTQATLAQRAGVTLASYRRFETRGKASLDLVLKVAHVLARLDEFADLLQPPVAGTMEELERMSRGSQRQRGSR